jgi:hypothetical protein
MFVRANVLKMRYEKRSEVAGTSAEGAR